MSIWRNWPRGGPLPAASDGSSYSAAALEGKPVHLRRSPVAAAAPAAAALPSFSGFASSRFQPDTPAVERIGLILPTSLCSGEVARQITAKLNAHIASGAHPALSRAVTRVECLPHTEGCGTGYPEGGIEMYNRIMLGHLTHPSVHVALCLEHGCEKTHNDFFTTQLKVSDLHANVIVWAMAVVSESMFVSLFFFYIFTTLLLYHYYYYYDN